jgi:hypothetical protein
MRPMRDQKLEKNYKFDPKHSASNCFTTHTWNKMLKNVKNERLKNLSHEILSFFLLLSTPTCVATAALSLPLSLFLYATCYNFFIKLFYCFFSLISQQKSFLRFLTSRSATKSQFFCCFNCWEGLERNRN